LISDRKTSLINGLRNAIAFLFRTSIVIIQTQQQKKEQNPCQVYRVALVIKLTNYKAHQQLAFICCQIFLQYVNKKNVFSLANDKGSTNKKSMIYGRRFLETEVNFLCTDPDLILLRSGTFVRLLGIKIHKIMKTL